VDADKDHQVKVVAVRQNQRQESQNQPEGTNLKPFIFQKPIQYIYSTNLELALLTAEIRVAAGTRHKAEGTR
jgi:hypothetical protein